jgi:hypothetical protein
VATQPPVADVVTVPDFSGRRAHLFEARTLFFLAAWMEHAGASRDWPLHIACIGEPPESVRTMAARTDADISVHAPFGVGAITGNKLRGFEVAPRTEHILLVDVDILTLGDLSGLSELRGSVSAAPIGKPSVRLRHWRAVYEIAGVDLPEERIASMHGLLIAPALERLRTSAQNEKLRRMVPMYNSGVVFAPWAANLRDQWGQASRAISARFVPEDESWAWVGRSNEVALAVAVGVLKKRGVGYKRLPDIYHTQWPQVWGTYRWGEPRMFHLMGFLRGSDDVVLGRDRLAELVQDYCQTYRTRHMDSDNRFKAVVKQNPETFLNFTNRLEEELLRLLDVHVAPLLPITQSVL